MFIYNVLSIVTNVLSSVEIDGLFHITTEDSCFYVESGGQPSDSGSINGHNIIKAYKQNDLIVHVLNVNLSGEVTIVVDKNIRQLHSLLHTTQHVVSAVFDEVKSYTSSFNIKGKSFSIDLSKQHNQSELDEVESKVNNIIYSGLNVIETVYKSDVDKEIDLPNVDKNKIRIIDIEGIDRNPCGGTHLQNTNQIRYVKFIKSKPSKGGTRLWVIAGPHALEFMREKFNAYREMVGLVGVEESETLTFLEKRLIAFKSYKKQLKYIGKNSDFDIKFWLVS